MPQIEVGYVQIRDFRPIFRYISETVQDRDIVTMEIGTRMRSIKWRYFPQLERQIEVR